MQMQTQLNPRHKVVYLNSNGKTLELWEYCINKGKELSRYPLKTKNENIVAVNFCVNGYYVYFHFYNLFNDATILHYSYMQFTQFLKHNYNALQGYGISINKSDL